MNVIDIEVVDVTIANQGKYDKMTVTHHVADNRGQMKVTAKALVSFATPTEVWVTLAKAQKGEHYQIEQQYDLKHCYQI